MELSKQPPTTITIEQVVATTAYSKMNPIRKQIIRKWNNIKAIDNGLKVSLHLGYENWSKDTNATNINKDIIKELYDIHRANV